MTPKPRVLTVSATYGSGGSVIAPLLADRLGLPFADRLIEPHEHPSSTTEHASDQELDEEPRSPLMRALALLSPTWNLPTAPEDMEDRPEQMREVVRAGIRDLAKAGGAVILGRAAAAVIGRERRWAFHVRIDGPSERRAHRGALWEGVDIETAKRRMATTDHARARYTQRLYGRDPTDPTLYHLVLDGTVLTSETSVDLIATAAGAYWAYDDDELERYVTRSRQRLAELRSDTRADAGAQEA